MTERAIVLDLKDGTRLYSPRVDVTADGTVTVIEPLQVSYPKSGDEK